MNHIIEKLLQKNWRTNKFELEVHDYKYAYKVTSETTTKVEEAKWGNNYNTLNNINYLENDSIHDRRA